MSHTKLGMLEKSVVGAMALLFGYAIFLPVEHNLVEFQGERYDRERFYSRASLVREAEILTEQLLETCNSFPKFESLDDSNSRRCKDAWQKANFQISEPIENADCELRLPGAILDTDHYVDVTRRETFEQIAQQLPCAPEFIGTFPIYETVELEELTFLQHKKIQSYEKHEYGDVQIFRISAGESTRYAGFLNVQGTLRIVGITNRREDAAQHLIENPIQVDVDDYRFTQAMVALGRVGATGCSSFVLYSDGLLYCFNGLKWRMDWNSGRVSREY